MLEARWCAVAGDSSASLGMTFRMLLECQYGGGGLPSVRLLWIPVCAGMTECFARNDGFEEWLRHARFCNAITALGIKNP